MQNGSKIIIGLILFLLIVTIPFSFNRLIAKNGVKGELQVEILPAAGDKCVRNKAYMRANHMDLLNKWRDEVVRQGTRFTESPKGGGMEKSLSNACLDCHSNKEEFCDKCHNYMAVEPYCWDCHLTAKETQDSSTGLAQFTQKTK